MNIRTAILKAADSIEMNPKMFNFMSTYRPGCGTPGCALGWVGHHLGVPKHKDENRYHLVVADALGFEINVSGLQDNPFYKRMDVLHGGYNWKYEAPACASVLRLYADKYHPAEPTIPDNRYQRFHAELVPADSDYEWDKVVA